MYPQGDLDLLATRKALLQARISVRRIQCGDHAARLAQPIRILDRAIAKWRQFSPWLKLIGIPAGLIMGRKMSKRGPPGKFSALLKYVPIAFQAARMITRARANSKARAEAEAHSF